MTETTTEQSPNGWQNWRGRPNRPPMTSTGWGERSPLLELRMGDGTLVQGYRHGGPTGGSWHGWWTRADAPIGQRLAVRELGGVVAWRLAAPSVSPDGPL